MERSSWHMRNMQLFTQTVPHGDRTHHLQLLFKIGQSQTDMFTVLHTGWFLHPKKIKLYWWIFEDILESIVSLFGIIMKIANQWTFLVWSDISKQHVIVREYNKYVEMKPIHCIYSCSFVGILIITDYRNKHIDRFLIFQTKRPCKWYFLWKRKKMATNLILQSQRSIKIFTLIYRERSVLRVQSSVNSQSVGLCPWKASVIKVLYLVDSKQS